MIARSHALLQKGPLPSALPLRPWAQPQRAADADEPPELNFIRKHALAMKAQGLSNPAARLFSNPAGEAARLAGKLFALTRMLALPRACMPRGAAAALYTCRPPPAPYTYPPPLPPSSTTKCRRLWFHGERTGGRLQLGGRRRAGQHVGVAQRLQVRQAALHGTWAGSAQVGCQWLGWVECQSKPLALPAGSMSLHRPYVNKPPPAFFCLALHPHAAALHLRSLCTATGGEASAARRGQRCCRSC